MSGILFDRVPILSKLQRDKERQQVSRRVVIYHGRLDLSCLLRDSILILMHEGIFI